MNLSKLENKMKLSATQYVEDGFVWFVPGYYGELVETFDINDASHYSFQGGEPCNLETALRQMVEMNS